MVGIEFWWACPRRVRWVEVEPVAAPGVDAARLYLVPAGAEPRQVAPLEQDTGLFLNFAETPLSTSGVAGFAARHGLLGLAEPASKTILVSHGRAGAMTGTRSEAFAAWVEEIERMREAVTLWDSLNRSDLATLSALIRWSGDTVAFVMPRPADHPAGAESAGAPTERLIAGAHYRTERFSQYPFGDLRQPAEDYLGDAINARLDAEPRLTGSTLTFTPRSLRGAMWLQFARAIHGRLEHRRCAACGRWFEVSPGVHRASRRYCADACRVRAHRQRRAARSTS